MRFARKILLALPLGLVACGGAGGGGGGDWDLDHLPPVVLGGGGGTVGLNISVNQPARLIASFGLYSEEGDEEDGVNAAVALEPGSTVLNVEVPADAYIYLELGIPEAQVGATFEWTVSVDGQQVWREKDRLDEALQPGYAFFGQVEAEDLADLKAWADY